MHARKAASVALASLLCGVFFLAAAPVATAIVLPGPMKEYTGDKEVYDEKKAPDTDDTANDARGKPSKPPAPEPTVDKWAVVIGISNYQGTGNDLQYCDDDAQDMYDYLIGMGYPSGNIKLLKDSKASARAILSAIDWMNKNEAKTTSECVFFYSGHGTTWDDYDDGDTEYTDECIVSADLYAILDGQLQQKFSTFTSQKIAFIFDSCYSGGMDDLAGTGRVVVTACAETELSWDGSSDQQNGVFTYYFMTGLDTYDTVEEAFDYADPFAANDVSSNYAPYKMDPQMIDYYTGTWGF